MRKDSGFVFYRHEKSKKFDIKKEDVLQAIEEQDLLEHLELLPVSRSNKLIEVRFDSEEAVQNFVDCDIPLNANSFGFWRNP